MPCVYLHLGTCYTSLQRFVQTQPPRGLRPVCEIRPGRPTPSVQVAVGVAMPCVGTLGFAGYRGCRFRLEASTLSDEAETAWQIGTDCVFSRVHSRILLIASFPRSPSA